ncbi:MAG: ribonuclease HI family protein [Prochloraceae cyanobacterium]
MNFDNHTRIWFDGSVKPTNPGFAAGAAIIKRPGDSLEQIVVSRFLDWGTSNEAEYAGLIAGLKRAKQLQIENILVFGDSLLIVNQVNSVWRTLAPNLKPLLKESRSLLSSFKNWQMHWIPRQRNTVADAAAGACLDLSIQNMGIPYEYLIVKFKARL